MNNALTFHSIAWMNFMSQGSDKVEIILDDTKSTVVRGNNGAGKSSFIEALYYAAYGRALRGVKIGQLINSINKKKSLVEFVFSCARGKFKISRGQKPKVFTLHQFIDDAWVEPNAPTDLQTYIETDLLGMSAKTFKQVVFMEVRDYTPFMCLSAPDRREFINTMLDLETFTVMAKLLAERTKLYKNKLAEFDNSHIRITTSIAAVQRVIDSMANTSDDAISRLESMIGAHNAQLVTLNDNLDTARNQYTAHQDLKSNIDVNTLLATINTLHSEIVANNSDISLHNHKHNDAYQTATFYATNTKCDRCHQEIDENFKAGVMSDLQSTCNEHKNAIPELEVRINNARNEIAKLQEQVNDHHAWERTNTQIYNNGIAINNQIASTTANIQQLLAEKEALMNKGAADTTSHLNEITQLNGELNEVITRRAEVMEQLDLCAMSAVVLSDKGIKTAVIDQYLPILNQTLNHYIEVLGGNYSFHLDKNFDETILSRYRDNFSYQSFSNGEKTRIDLALIFAFRKLSEIKSTVSSNLILIDEVLDSSLDEQGVKNVVNLFETLDGKNSFVITQRESLVEHFDSTLRVEKSGNFATYTYDN